MSDRYEYKPLDPDHIRLLHILPESTVNDIRGQLVDYSPDLSKRNRFAALSYCWGDPTPVATITIDGKPFDVAHNLYDFLQNRFLHGSHELSHDPESRLSGRGLWVDAICINQADNEEKSSQVQGMWRVYSCADLVIAWLGKEKAFTAQAFRTLKSLYDGPAVTSGYTAVELLMKDFTNVSLLCEEPYFSRMWVVQEVVCADAHLMLHSGPHVVPFEALLKNYNPLEFVAQIKEREELASDKEGFLLIKDLRLLLHTVHASRDAQTSDLNTEEGRATVILAYLAALNTQCDKQCSDRRDKIFALRSLPEARLMESELSIPPILVDYTMTVDETAVVTLAYCSRLDHKVQLYDNGLFYKGWLRDTIYLAFGFDILNEMFRTWLLQNTYRDDEQGILEMITGSGRRIDCLCPAIPYILRINRNLPANATRETYLIGKYTPTISI